MHLKVKGNINLEVKYRINIANHELINPRVYNDFELYKKVDEMLKKNITESFKKINGRLETHWLKKKKPCQNKMTVV